jgi:hypothetical protein
MKGELTKEHLDFYQECKEVFERLYKRETHINEEGTLIGLRYGADRDCIRIYDLGPERAFFHNVLEKCPTMTIRVEEFE